MYLPQTRRALKYKSLATSNKKGHYILSNLNLIRCNSNSGDFKNDKTSGMAGFVVDDNETSYKDVSVISREDFFNFRDRRDNENRDDSIHKKTLTYKYNSESKTISIPFHVANSIQDMIFKYGNIRVFKQNLKTFIDDNLSNENNLIRPISKPKEASFYIASQFHRDYASNYQALSELKQKINSRNESKVFSPKRILNVTNGPATGIIALHEIMKEDVNYNPSQVDVHCLGNEEMSVKAKMLLSTYRMKKDKNLDGNDSFSTNKKSTPWTNFLNKQPSAPDTIDSLVKSKPLYDLIILEHALVNNEKLYTANVTKNIKSNLKLLSPNGHLVLIEKGNPFGFEIIAQARENIIKPNQHPLETGGKIPRPYYFSSIVSEKDTEDNDADVMKTSHYYTILGPCSHHGSCPLQLYDYKLHHLRGKTMKSCTNQKKVILPKYYMELMRGKINMTPSSSEFKNKDSKRKIVSGREFQDNFAIHSYSYLIVERSSDDPAAIANINEARNDAQQNHTNIYPVGSIGKNSSEYPRILNIKLNKKHIDMALCAPSGNIEKWAIGKSKMDRITYKDLKKARKNDCWPHDNDGFTKKVSGRAASKTDYIELKKFLIALKKEETKLLHEQLIQNLDEINKAMDNGQDVSLEDKLAIKVTLKGLEEKMNDKNKEQMTFSKAEYRKALSFVRNYKLKN
ncbi:uncharacterized protein HGUI_01342 [Hanseniaspora guilliermondii]|uniref:37S ribosomal protein S22, mitochondrial n=1 Tax=Hanseniaspora guilliermondii TaxID=56406 RepID=A0A1L0FHS8_9ASCO|nr:uncharacterized protein HGUI_01342 [Hanseniaspora guilliermondii]